MWNIYREMCNLNDTHVSIVLSLCASYTQIPAKQQRSVLGGAPPCRYATRTQDPVAPRMCKPFFFFASDTENDCGLGSARVRTRGECYT